MNKLSRDERARIIALLVEGNSLRAIARITGVSINTVTKLLVDAGRACSDYQDKVLRNLPCKRLQIDEIWAFNYCKAKTVALAKKAPANAGDIWTFVAIDADTKLIPSWFIGERDAHCALEFLLDLRGRLTSRVQLTSDGHTIYADTVSDAFADEIDYAVLIKHYAAPRVELEASRRYSPTICTGAETRTRIGKPDRDHISTSYVERQNLTMRMCMRRFTRLTNAFSKKAQNHVQAVALHFMYYNFCRIHQSLRVTPAMAAGVTSKLWEISDIVRALEEWELPSVRAA
jgi:IS1 family transposase/lambda repressor-like predicted transcriptional regulator